MINHAADTENPVPLPSLPDNWVSADVPDWGRETLAHWQTWDPGRQLLKAIREYQKWRAAGDRLTRLRSKGAVLTHRFWSSVSGADIPLNSHIEGGLLLPHPNGIVVHPEARIGPNCLLFQQVTLGQGPVPGLPVLEGHVDIGAGARILGGVRVGQHAIVGANAVVISDVPPGATVVGVPARVVKIRSFGHGGATG